MLATFTAKPAAAGAVSSASNIEQLAGASIYPDNTRALRLLHVRRLTRCCAISFALKALGSQPPFDKPIEFVMRAVFPVPASWSQRKRDQAVVGDIKPAKKPDLDNIAKAWNDALNGVVDRDDPLIVRMTLEKHYGQQPLVAVTVKSA
jgi:Holliday junction resolvase RusA-like endonuclease